MTARASRSPFWAPLERDEALQEIMDDPDCDLAMLHATYAQFGVLNDLLSGWSRAWREVLLPAARRALRDRGHVTMLDVGCGGGDLPRRFAAWANRDGVPLTITAIDPDARALAYARSRPTPPGVRYEPWHTRDLAQRGETFDLVVSNHVLHHVASEELTTFLGETVALTREVALHSDLFRTRLALPAFWVFSLPFQRSLLREDGRRSIHRAWTPRDLEPHLPPRVRADRRGRFRLWVTFDAREDAAS